MTIFVYDRYIRYTYNAICLLSLDVQYQLWFLSTLYVFPDHSLQSDSVENESSVVNQMRL